MKRLIENIRAKFELDNPERYVNAYYQLFRKQRILFLGIFMFFSLLTWKSSYAERCWLVNCKDMVGYIYIPKSQYIFDDSRNMPLNKDTHKSYCKNKEVFNNAKNYQIYKGLPKVGEIIFPRSNDINIYKSTDDISDNFKNFEEMEFKYEDEVRKNGKSNLQPFVNYSYMARLKKDEMNSKDRSDIERNKKLLMQDCSKETYLLAYGEGASYTWGGSLKTKIISYTTIKDELFAQIKILESGEKREEGTSANQ